MKLLQTAWDLYYVNASPVIFILKSPGCTLKGCIYPWFWTPGHLYKWRGIPTTNRYCMLPPTLLLWTRHVHIRMWFTTKETLVTTCTFQLLDQYGTGCHLCQTILWLEVFTCTRVGYICMFIKVLKVMHLVAFSLSHPHTWHNDFYLLTTGWRSTYTYPPAQCVRARPCYITDCSKWCHSVSAMEEPTIYRSDLRQKRYDRLMSVHTSVKSGDI